uniref:Transposase n=1 Tax=Heterorhabditis bacteriophora TaxID=37862 RepID=A0A1I7WIL9_HETBA
MTPDRRDGSLLRRKREQWAREKGLKCVSTHHFFKQVLNF